MDMGYLGELVLSGTIKADTEVGGTSDRLALTTCTDNVCFPIRLRFVKPALQATTFRDRSPGVLGSGNGGDQASLWKWNVTRASGFTFFYHEAAG
ncbi:MAG: hypothetical protein WBK08_17125 [Nitrospira sp.]|nr:MAG: hypothetical protein E8D42_13080 [Nitrospira sp.]